MKLSAEQFAELASSFGAVASPAQHERRRANRMDLQARIRITPIISGRRLHSTDVMACDFSARGLAFLNPIAIPCGRQFITHLPRRSGGQVDLLCTVAHCEEVGNNAFRVGVEFTCAVPGSAQTHDADDEKREARRIRESMMQ